MPSENVKFYLQWDTILCERLEASDRELWHQNNNSGLFCFCFSEWLTGLLNIAGGKFAYLVSKPSTIFSKQARRSQELQNHFDKTIRTFLFTVFTTLVPKVCFQTLSGQPPSCCYWSWWNTNGSEIMDCINPSACMTLWLVDLCCILECEQKLKKQQPTTLTNIMSLIKHYNRCFLQFFGNKVSYFRIQQVMIAVYHNISMINLKCILRKRMPS